MLIVQRTKKLENLAQHCNSAIRRDGVSHTYWQSRIPFTDKDGHL